MTTHELYLISPQPLQSIKTTRTRIPVLDGLRGFSVFLVIISHYLIHFSGSTHSGLMSWLSLIFHGELGVRFFFVISGFIITLLLIQERQNTGKINLIAFYFRRGVRLVPALYCFFMVTLLVSTFSSSPFPSANCVWTSLTFTGGFYRNCGWTYGNLWSLTVEEVFYISWPFLIHCALSPGKSICLFIGISTFARVFDYTTQVETFWVFGFLDQIAVGAALASLYSFHRNRLTHYLSLSVHGVLILGGVLIYVPHVLAHFGKFGWFLLPFGSIVQAVGIALLLASALVSEHGAWHTLLSFKWLRRVGLFSYSLYLWQQLFFGSSVLGRSSFAVLTQFPLNLVLMFLCGAASYYWIELPVQRFYSKIRQYKHFQSKHSSEAGTL